MLAQFKFKILRLTFSLITSALIAWPVAASLNGNWLLIFLCLSVGLPLVVWLERLKNVPAHLLAAYLMHKELINPTKKALKRLPLKTPEEWRDFQIFYDSDEDITRHAMSDPKAFAVSVRYSVQTMRDCGNFMDCMNSGLICSQAIDQMTAE